MQSQIVELTDPSTDDPVVHPGDSGGARFARIALALPPLLVLVIGVAILNREGGFDTLTWYPAALLCLGLIGVMAFVGVRAPRGIVAAAVLVLAGYVVLTFLSVLWADVDDIAWQGANLTLLYALVFVAMVLSRLPAPSTGVLVFAFGAGVMITGLVVVARGAFGTTDPADSILFAGRLSEPTGYPNATAAMFGLALWSMLGVVLEPTARRWIRASALGVAGVIAGLDLLCQSRGATFTLPLVVVGFLVLARRRYIAAAVVGAVGLATLVAAPVLLDVFPAATSAARRDALGAAFVVLIVIGLCLGLIGLLLPLLDGLPGPGPTRRRRLRLGGAALAVAVIAGAALFASPATRLSEAWHSFKSTGTPQGTSRFVGLGSNRYDFWRVGLSEFQSHPLVGIGVDNFAVPYLRERRSSEQPLYPHSLWVRVVSQTGLIGAILLAGFFVLATIAALRPRAGLPRGLIGGVLTAVIAWLLHAQVDWLWEMPALGFAAFALLGLAVGVGDPVDAPRSVGSRSRARMLGEVALVLGGIVAGLSFAIPWLSARYQSQAVDAWRSDPQRAIILARRAAAVDPLTDDPHVLAGAMQSRLRNYAAMRDEFAEAVSRNPFNWYAELELGAAYSALGERTLARRHVLQALELNPHEPIVRRTLTVIERGQVVEPASIDRAVAASDPT